MAIVLLVEESQTIRRVVEMALKGSGHDLIVATNGAECRQAIYQYAIGVLLINYILPDINGLDLCREVKSHPSTGHLPVVILGGAYAPFNENQAFTAGADTVLIKPFLTDDLISSINRLLAARPAMRQPAMPVSGQPSHQLGPSQAVSQPAPYAPTPPPRAPQPPESAAYGSGYGALSPPAPLAPQPSYGYAPPAAQAGAPPTAAVSPFGRGPVSREVSSSQRAPFQPAARYPSGQYAPVPPRPPSGRFPRGFQPPAPQAAPPSSARVPSGVAPVAPPAAPQRLAPAPPPEAPAGPMMEATVDPQELRSVLREVLPPIVRDALRQLFRDGLELRLRNYVQERVDQAMREEVHQLVGQAIQEEILRRRDRS